MTYPSYRSSPLSVPNQRKPTRSWKMLWTYELERPASGVIWRKRSSCARAGCLAISDSAAPRSALRARWAVDAPRGDTGRRRLLTCGPRGIPSAFVDHGRRSRSGEGNAVRPPRARSQPRARARPSPRDCLRRCDQGEARDVGHAIATARWTRDEARLPEATQRAHEYLAHRADLLGGFGLGGRERKRMTACRRVQREEQRRQPLLDRARRLSIEPADHGAQPLGQL